MAKVATKVKRAVTTDKFHIVNLKAGLSGLFFILS
jgi:hypothetical protein